MVNPDSPTFRFFEKVGYISGKLIKIIVIGSVVTFLAGKLKPGQPQTQPPAEP